MENLSNHFKIPVKIKNFKCFGEEPQGFEEVKPLNIIIGKNNSGKSSLLDLIQYVSSKNFQITNNQYRNNRKPIIQLSSTIEKKDAQAAFSRPKNTKDIEGSVAHFINKLVGRTLIYQHNNASKQTALDVIPGDDVPSTVKYELDLLSEKQPNPYKSKVFKKISSERDISPEPFNKSLNLASNGAGATNIIQNFLHRASLESDYVSEYLLDALNYILAPDSKFTNILCQQLENNNWEIFLEEKDKGRIHLSNSGSGLKTIILCLISLILTPKVEKNKLNSYLFAFEELENNLHPALLRNLLLYLRQKALDEGCVFFLTTHSNVVIDLFSKDDSAQILHVTQDANQSIVNTVSSYYDNVEILNDLDVRASDLLQSNMIIWVEGPSDRVLLNRWIELLSSKTLFEGAQYQIVFYGGRLLSHLTFKNPDSELEELIKLLTINRNAAILIDSDKSVKQTPLNKTKKRIIKELNQIGGYTWVTKGREIENYIPLSVINKSLDTNYSRNVNKYGKFDTYLNKVKKGLGQKYLRNKVKYSHLFADNFNPSDLENNLDLKSQTEKLVQYIQKVNK